MKINLKQNLYLLITGFTLLCLPVIKWLHFKTDWITKTNAEAIGNPLKIIFLLGFLGVGCWELFQTRQTVKSIFTLRNFLIFSLLVSLVFSVFAWRLNAYTIGFYVFFAVVYFLSERRLFALNKIYFFVFAFALLNFIGTIGTPAGFHFPEITYSFYILPLSYSLFHLEKQTLLRILRLFFRIIFVYMCISIIFWWFNITYFEVSPLKWMSSKIFIGEKSGYTYVEGWSNFMYGSKWVNYSHPSYTALVILAAMIGGFYLHYKKNKAAFVSTLELVLFTTACTVINLAMQSRVGAICLILIAGISMLYYVKMRTNRFKTILFLGLMAGVLAISFTKNIITRVATDKPREISYTLSTNYIKDNLWWGSGYGEQRAALIEQEQKMPEVEKLPNSEHFLYTHNQFLGQMVQFGIPGLVVLLVMLAALIYYSIKNRNYLLQMLLLLYIIFMMIEEPLYIQEGIMRFMVFLCFFIAIGEGDKIRKSYNVNALFSKVKSME